MGLKEEILANPFIEHLRELKIDRGAYSLLCEQLRQLRVEWAGKTMIDKQLMQEIYALPWIAWGVARTVRKRSIDKAAEVDEIRVELDGLILECLA